MFFLQPFSVRFRNDYLWIFIYFTFFAFMGSDYHLFFFDYFVIYAFGYDSCILKIRQRQTVNRCCAYQQVISKYIFSRKMAGFYQNPKLHTKKQKVSYSKMFKIWNCAIHWLLLSRKIKKNKQNFKIRKKEKILIKVFVSKQIRRQSQARRRKKINEKNVKINRKTKENKIIIFLSRLWAYTLHTHPTSVFFSISLLFHFFVGIREY